MNSGTLSILLLFLFFAAVLDVRHGELSLVLIGAAFVLGLILQILFGNRALPELLSGCLPGVCLLLFSLISNQALGFGDGGVAVAAGVFLGFTRTLLLLLLSFLISGLSSLVLLVVKNRKRKEEVPFVPFLLAGYVALLAAGY